MNAFRKIAEIAANISIVVLAVLVGYFMINRLFSSPLASDLRVEDRLTKGTSLSLPNVDFAKSERNLLMVLSPLCRFCNESIPFYQRLSKMNTVNNSPRIIAAFSEVTAESQKYLEDKNVAVDEIIKASPREVQVRGTPTLILVDKNGIILESWAGKLSPEKEREVIEKVFGYSEVVEKTDLDKEDAF